MKQIYIYNVVFLYNKEITCFTFSRICPDYRRSYDDRYYGFLSRVYTLRKKSRYGFNTMTTAMKNKTDIDFLWRKHFMVVFRILELTTWLTPVRGILGLKPSGITTKPVEDFFQVLYFDEENLLGFHILITTMDNQYRFSLWRRKC